jgi:hypothetical protein
MNLYFIKHYNQWSTTPLCEELKLPLRQEKSLNIVFLMIGPNWSESFYFKKLGECIGSK